jgi:hypothetical protein
MLHHRIRTPFLNARERFLFIHWLLLIALSTMHQNYHQIMEQNCNNKKTQKHRKRLELTVEEEGLGLSLEDLDSSARITFSTSSHDAVSIGSAFSSSSFSLLTT